MKSSSYNRVWIGIIVLLLLLGGVSTVNGAETKTYTNSIGMEFVYIPAGDFQMGSPEDEDGRLECESPMHEVSIGQDYYLGTYEVTQEQWVKVMGTNPSYFKGDQNPVEMVSPPAVQKFIQKLNEMEDTDKYRLPSEAEWEYACRAGTTTRYSFGDDDSDLSYYAWYLGNSEYITHPVGQKEPNPWGLYDMYGNIFEFCQDWEHQSYEGAPTDGSAWIEDGNSGGRVIRGGSIVQDYCRSASRGFAYAYGANELYGFRVAMDVSETNPVENYALLEVSITPSEIASNAKWKLSTESEWHESDEEIEVETGIYTVEFGEVGGWNTPSDRQVTVVEGVNSVTGNYIKSVAVYEDLTVVHITDVHMGYVLTAKDLKLLGIAPSRTTYNLIQKNADAEIKLKRQYFSDAMQEVQELKPNLIIATGDLVEYGHENYFNDFITIINNQIILQSNTISGPNDKVLCTPGNHDRRVPINSEGASNPFPQSNNLDKYNDLIAPWYPDERVKEMLGTNGDYYIDKGGYYFIGLDSGQDFNCSSPTGTPESTGLTSDQMDYLESLDSDIPKIIFMHHPVVTDEPDNEEEDSENPVIDNIVTDFGNNHCIANNRERFVEYCRNNNVLAVLTGHTHYSYVYDSEGSLIDLLPTLLDFGPNYNAPYFIQTRSLTKDAEHGDKEFNHGYSLINFERGEIQSITDVETAGKKRWTSTLGCPANLHVYDSQGMHTGLNNGEFEYEVPDSFHYEGYDIDLSEDIKFHIPETIILYDMEEKYEFQIRANFSEEEQNDPRNQHFNFTLEKQDENDVTELSYTNVPLTENTVATLQVSDDTNEYVMQIDMNDDGIIDETREPDSISSDETLNPESLLYSDTNESINTSIEGDYSNDEESASTIYKDVQSTVDSMIEEINPQVPSDLKKIDLTSNFYSIGLILILVIGVIMLYRKS